LNNDIGYIIVASSFILILNLMAFISLRVNYKSTRKAYLLLASIAILFEALRQVPALLLSFSPESFPAVLLTFLLQFASSWMLLCAITRKESEITKNQKILLGSLVALYAFSTLFTVLNGYPQTTLHWAVITLPGIVTVFAIILGIRQIEFSALTGKVLLILSATALAIIRVSLLLIDIMPLDDSVELVYLLFYLDVLVFPILVATLVLAEVEQAHAQVSALLKEKTRSETNFRFILDNTEEVILTVNQAGLLQTWNKRAASVFGYTSVQTIRKMYIDDLFSGKYFHKDVDQEQAISATMERMDGRAFPATARIKTVIDGSDIHSIYVIKDGEIIP